MNRPTSSRSTLIDNLFQQAVSYDLLGRQVSHLDVRGNEWQTQYPGCCNRSTLSIDPLGHGTITHTDAAGHVTHAATVADVLSHANHLNPTDAQTLQETTTKYDERGRAIASTVWLSPRGEVDPENPPIAGEGNVAATEGLTTKYRYDDDLDDGAGLDQEFSSHLTGLNLGVNADGSARLVTNPAGERSLAISDGRGRSVKSVQLAANGEALVSQVQTYDALVTINGYGDVLETASANTLGNTNKQRTDGAGRTIQSVDAENFITSFQYDANGNRLSVRDGNNVGQDCVYDVLNRDKQCADTQELLDNMNRRKVFNLAGQVVQDIDAKNAITSSTYDARGRRISTTDRINATTTFMFDAAGNELSMTDAENQTTSYSYDALNRRLTIQWPDHVAGTVPGDQHYGIQHTAYDAAGRALRKTDQRGDTITLIYDLAGRMLRREYRTLANSTPLEEGLPTGPVADQDTFSYDAASRMLTATKGRYSNTVTFTYDTGGRRATESLSSLGFHPEPYSISYAYDAAGRESQLTYPDGTVVQRTFTPRSQLQSVSLTEPGSNTALSVSTFEYDAGRRETSRTYGNGITTTRTYRADNLVTGITAPAVESLSYTYDVNKNPTSELRSGVMAPYSWATGESGFDAQNRLTNWTRQNGDSQSWQLTAVNDWQTFTNNGVPQQRTHGPTHEIQSIDTVPLQHDSRGNLTQDNRGTSMTYDADNMLSVFNANAVEGLRNATYTYDALGRRVSKTVAGATANDPSTTTLFILANQQVIAEYQSTGTQPPTLAARTAYGTYIDEPLILLSNLTSQIAYYHTNRQYSVYALTDAAASVLDRVVYTPYGEHFCFTPAGAPRSQLSEASNRTHFTGRTADVESGLHYFRARYFLPFLGRFTERDPMEYVGAANSFDFGQANPVNATDASGLLPIKSGNWTIDIFVGPTLLDDALPSYSFMWKGMYGGKMNSATTQTWQLNINYSSMTFAEPDGLGGCDCVSKDKGPEYVVDITNAKNWLPKEGGKFVKKDTQALLKAGKNTQLCYFYQNTYIIFGFNKGSKTFNPDNNKPTTNKDQINAMMNPDAMASFEYTYQYWNPANCSCDCSVKRCKAADGRRNGEEELSTPFGVFK